MKTIDVQGPTQENKLMVEHPFFSRARKKLRHCLKSYVSQGETRCIAILGPSCSGKSTAIRAVATERRVIDGKSVLKWDVRLVYIPAYLTVKNIASAVLNALGDPCDSTRTLQQMTDRTIQLIKEKGVHMLVFDEMENLVSPESKINQKATDWLIWLICTIDVPIVIVGHEQTEELFSANVQLCRRFAIVRSSQKKPK